MRRVCAGCSGEIVGADYRVVGMVLDGRGIPTNVICHPGSGCEQNWRKGQKDGRSEARCDGAHGGGDAGLG